MIVIGPHSIANTPESSSEETEFRKYITALASYCKVETFHGEYSSRLQFMESGHLDDNENSETKMDVFIDSVYLWYRVRVYPGCRKMYDQKDFKGLGAIVLHETCHLFIEPVAKLFMWDACASQRTHYEETIERQTERICNSIMYTLPKEWYMPDKLLPAKETITE